MRFLFVFILLLPVTLAFSQVKLPRLISDGMVLQRDKNLSLWGWASPGENVSVTLSSKTYSTTTTADGKWSVELPPQKAGGPYTLEIKGSNTITVNDVLFGEVWLCSGQSNMELTMTRVKDNYGVIIAQCENPNIRQFLVADKYDFRKEHDDLDEGSWKSVNPKTILDFSAVAYFFAKEIHEKYKVPVGLINAALGGSPVEAWMSQDALKKFPELYLEAQKFQDDQLIADIESNDRKRAGEWHTTLNTKDEGIKKWNSPDVSDKDWQEMKVPGYWSDSGLGNVNGSVWFRKTITVPATMTGKPGKLWMGRIVDADSIFINGKFAGTTGYQYPPRKYEFGPALLKEGENVIAIRVINTGGRGGFVLDKPYFLTAGGDTIDLKGTWKMKRGAEMPAMEGGTTVRWKPSGLYNRMISPLLKYSVKGVIWYQGESNTRNPKQYEELFPGLINTWRTNWKQGDFPFLFVQLANFMDRTEAPTESQWAELREAQLKTLSVPNTGMAVTIDIGEWNDIHPLNKKDVGHRLALQAEHVAYTDKKVVSSGPLYKSHTKKGDTMVITFTGTGSGLVANGSDELKYFAIAGPDKKFVWAKAKIKGNTVIVWSDQVANPVTVRYAWADNPEGANLYNREGLPASPFQTKN